MFAMFDLDNTLSDRSATFLDWVEEFAAEYRLPKGASEWVVAIDADGYSTRRSLFEAVRSRFEITASVNTLIQRYQRRIVELSRLSPGAFECLQQLRSQGWTTAIVSNGSSEQQNGKVDALGLRSLVDAVIVSADVGHRKPEPAIFQVAAGRAGADLVGSWMIGDSPLNDVIGPARLGVSTVWVRRERVWSETAGSPNRTIDSLTELLHTPLTVTSGR